MATYNKRGYKTPKEKEVKEDTGPKTLKEMLAALKKQ